MVVVRAEEGDRVEALISDLPAVRVLVNRKSEAGRTGSLQCGLGSLPEGAAGAIIHPIDHPLVSRDTIRALLEEHDRCFKECPSPPPLESIPLVFEPAHECARGHPLLFGRDAFPALMALKSAEPLRSVVRRLRASGRAREVEVDDRWILANLDTRADLRRWGLDRE